MAWRRIAAAAFLIAVGGPAAAEEGKPDPVLAELGQPLFERHCAACHGTRGRGDGPVAQVLRTRPADLTSIAARRGGDFPTSEIVRFIDGRFDLPAHGTREMPVWGYRFGADVPEPEVGESIARGNIVSLVEYLKSIQSPSPSGSKGDSR
jgi:mono/diheme cytochrome c family protein